RHAPHSSPTRRSSDLRPSGPPAAQQAPRPAPSGHAGSAPRNDERMQRREQLYAVVRDVMVRAGVLSAGYKFKVLSLDPRGAQFLDRKSTRLNSSHVKI